MNIKNYFNSVIDTIKQGAGFVISHPKTFATAGTVILGLGATDLQAQSTDSTSTKVDTIKVESYNPIMTIRPKTEYHLNSKKSKVYTADPVYSVDRINTIIGKYDQGIISADTAKNGMDDITMDYFRSISVPGLAEYTKTKKDDRLMTIIGSIINNKRVGENVGDITIEENDQLFEALRAAGYSKLKILIQEHDELTMKLANGKKAIYPARDIVKGYVLEDNMQGPADKSGMSNTISYDTNGCDTCGFVQPPKPTQGTFTVLYVKGGLGYNNDIKGPTANLGLGLDIHGFIIGATGAYGLWMPPATSEFFPNAAAGNIGAGARKVGTRVDNKYTNTVAQFGGEVGADLGKIVELCLHGEFNMVNKNVDVTSTADVLDDAGNIDYRGPKIDKFTEKNPSNYFTWGPEVRGHINDRLSIYANAQFRQQKLNGAHVGVAYRFGSLRK